MSAIKYKFDQYRPFIRFIAFFIFHALIDPIFRYGLRVSLISSTNKLNHIPWFCGILDWYQLNDFNSILNLNMHITKFGISKKATITAYSLFIFYFLRVLLSVPIIRAHGALIFVSINNSRRSCSISFLILVLAHWVQSHSIHPQQDQIYLWLNIVTYFHTLFTSAISMEIIKFTCNQLMLAMLLESGSINKSKSSEYHLVIVWDWRKPECGGFNCRSDYFQSVDLER